MNKEGWGEQQIWGSPAGTTLSTHRSGAPFVFRAGKKLSWGCGTWFAGSAQAWISGPVVHPKLSGAPSTDQAPLWSRKGRATLFMWPVPLPDRCRFCRGVQDLNPRAELGFIPARKQAVEIIHAHQQNCFSGGYHSKTHVTWARLCFSARYFTDSWGLTQCLTYRKQLAVYWSSIGLNYTRNLFPLGYFTPKF